jgi:hypothetical protein
MSGHKYNIECGDDPVRYPLGQNLCFEAVHTYFATLIASTIIRSISSVPTSAFKKIQH